MTNRTDQELMGDYVERRSEAAFTELVRRHIDLVHSAAIRMVRDPHLAEDVTQRTFSELVRAAPQLTHRAILSGWLHRTAQNLAAKTVRAEVRRRAHEQEAVAMNDSSTALNEPAWEQVAPHLDAALGELNEPDRDALLLRYCQGKTARQIAETLGLSEEAAQKRLTRALEKLRGAFSARGVAISSSALAGLLGVQAVQTAPAVLAASVATASLATGAATGFTLLSLMASTTVKLSVATAVVAALATPLVLQQRQVKKLRAENAALLEQVHELQSKATNAPLVQPPAISDELARQQAEHLELLRLRGEVTRLGNELRQRAATQIAARTANALPPVALTNGPPPSFAYNGVAVAKVGNGATFAMGGWNSAPGRRAFLFVTPSLPPDLQPPDGGKAVLVQTRLVEFPEEDLSESLHKQLALVGNGASQYGFSHDAPVFLQNDPDYLALKAREEYQNGTNVTIVTTPSVTTLDGRRARVSVGQQVPATNFDGTVEYHFLGTAIDLVPQVAADGIKVEAMISFNPPEAAQPPPR